MGWFVLWFFLIALQGGAAAALWVATGYWHPGMPTPEMQPTMRRLCMIAWLLMLLVLQQAVITSEHIVVMLQRAVYGG